MNLATETVTFVSDITVLPVVADHIARAGYPARQTITRLRVDAMSYASCVGRVERVLLAQAGVLEASVNLATQTAIQTATLTVLDGTSTPDALARAVTEAGYDTSIPQADDIVGDRKDQEERALFRSTLIAGLLTLPVFLIEMGSHFSAGVHMLIERTLGQQNSWMLQFIVISIVMMGPGWRFYKKGIPALLRGAPDMNSLVALGLMGLQAIYKGPNTCCPAAHKKHV